MFPSVHCDSLHFYNIRIIVHYLYIVAKIMVICRPFTQCLTGVDS